MVWKYYYSGRAMLLGEHGIGLLLSSQFIGNDYRHFPSVRHVRSTHSLRAVTVRGDARISVAIIAATVTSCRSKWCCNVL